MFSAKDLDNDLNGSDNCAFLHQGPWWYNDCYNANLNIPIGLMFWGSTLSRSVMMIRKI